MKTDPKSAAVLQAQAVVSMAIDSLSVIQAALLDQRGKLREAVATSEVVGILGEDSLTVEGWLAGVIEAVNESLVDAMFELSPPENGWRSHVEAVIASAAEAGDEKQGGATLLDFRRKRPEDN